MCVITPVTASDYTDRDAIVCTDDTRVTRGWQADCSACNGSSFQKIPSREWFIHHSTPTISFVLFNCSVNYEPQLFPVNEKPGNEDILTIGSEMYFGFYASDLFYDFLVSLCIVAKFMHSSSKLLLPVSATSTDCRVTGRTVLGTGLLVCLTT
jgi:hypothetical protein